MLKALSQKIKRKNSAIEGGGSHPIREFNNPNDITREGHLTPKPCKITMSLDIHRVFGPNDQTPFLIYPVVRPTIMQRSSWRC